MKNQFLKQNQETNLRNNEFTAEDFTEIHEMVDELLTSLKGSKKRKAKLKSPRTTKQWNKKNKKPKNLEDLGIRELPFTF
ncbi:MAG: hypothetical protein KBA66_15380 [Leptospiraceae bacterium]|nr:hypothetical protein [Leptospiraceae bacterium]